MKESNQRRIPLLWIRVLWIRELWIRELWTRVLGCAALLAMAPVWGGESGRVEHQGLVVEMHVEGVSARDGIPRAGSPARVRFKVYDKATQSPLAGVFPAAWAHPRDAVVPAQASGQGEDRCHKQAETFLGGSLFSRAAVDMNTYQVLALNDDATISVVDPLFGFGGSKLLTMLPLPGIGYDWVKTTRQDSLYVSVPATDQIVKINPINWTLQTLSGGDQWHSPRHIVLQKDQQFLWTVVTLPDGNEGVAVIDLATFSVRQVIPTGRGITALALSHDGKAVWVLNAASQQLSVLSTKTFRPIHTLPLAEKPVSLAQSELAQSLYVGHEKSGVIKVFDTGTYRPLGDIQGRVGMGPIRFSPNGRWGFVINAAENRVSLIDASKNRIVQSSVVEDRPHDISFSDNLAYIRHSGSPTVLMITLDDRELGQEGKRIPAVDTVGGDRPPGLIGTATAAPGIVQAPGANAVLMANYHDQVVYFYKEGMAAPMGQFNNYNRSPRAVMAIDRSLRELDSPGEYETVVHLPTAGVFDVVYFMDSPRILHCFELQVAGEKTNDRHRPEPEIVARHTAKTFKVGDTAELDFSVHTDDAAPIAGMQVVISLASGLWRDKRNVAVSEDGRVSLSFTPPARGTYTVALYPRSADSGADSAPYQPAKFTYLAQ